ncbi:hypothetical protein H8356DRAFT_1634353 [Neocallimastix lanati (nom. inval.)]|jgi:phosphatidylinositol glycan class S|uniref:Uncharacterized protein n=1 Tax=Neocallimastix californiae TaxID=1754190 RepID=A0A1Y2E2D1_9FUNG|nr:hypothetical protein H8356DRAFT_1634353 [Neocallimastix sp. JGI-2020a]ORY65708.1 hypothetical protein LY90DRAFT_380321 [Neocallimastix californiae]|eukprot:ORY65708.1 hypothetical protein LY90DRAFT_380321 [Neocallimastix californiae]
MRRERELYEKHQVSNRLHIIGSIWLVFLIGIPIWWKTTEVYRASLPYKEVQKWQDPNSLYINFSIQLSYVIPSDIAKNLDVDSLNKNIQNEFDKNNIIRNDNEQENIKVDDDFEYSYPPKIGYNFNVNTEVTKKWNSDIGLIKNIDENFDDFLTLENNTDDKAEYYVYILKQKESAKSFADIYLGKNKQFIVFLKEFTEENIIKYTTPIIINMFANEHSDIISSFTEERDENESKEEIKKMRTFKYASKYQILYSLFNGNVNDYMVNWEIEKSIKSYFGPFFDTLALISKFDITSQVQNFATLPLTARFSNRSDNKYYYLEAKDLGHFINSAEWNLASPVSTAPPINFILYIPPISQSPLYIQDSNGEILETNAFLIPRWGGIVIDKNRNSTSEGNSNRSFYNYTFEDLHPIMELFLEQLRSLLGINEIKFLPSDLPRNVRVLYGSDSKRGITSWELDQLLRKRTVQNLVNASRTLNSLAKLVGSLPNMVVLDRIQEKIVYALDCLDHAYKEVNGRNYKKAFVYSKNALIASEEAFFDPTMVSMLYFPDEHKYAVYMPLFLPISVPLALVLKEEFKKRKKNKKQQKDKEKKEIKTNIKETTPNTLEGSNESLVIEKDE